MFIETIILLFAFFFFSFLIVPVDKKAINSLTGMTKGANVSSKDWSEIKLNFIFGVEILGSAFRLWIFILPLFAAPQLIPFESHNEPAKAKRQDSIGNAEFHFS